MIIAVSRGGWGELRLTGFTDSVEKVGQQKQFVTLALVAALAHSVSPCRLCKGAATLSTVARRLPIMGACSAAATA